jgi:hypothetical protein
MPVSRRCPSFSPMLRSVSSSERRSVGVRVAACVGVQWILWGEGTYA